MQITRQADYALRAMLYLSRLNKNARAATRIIAEEMQIPSSFLAKIVSQLSIAGLINTSRGAHGGVTLMLTPREISVLEVVEAIDGPIALNQCTHDPSTCPFGERCPIHETFCEAEEIPVNKLRNTSFAELLARESQTRR